MSLYSQRAIREILAAEPVNRIRIVGVDGPSGSGKSSFARELATALDAPVIQTDDFAAWTNLSGWWPRFEQQVLTPLLAGDPAKYQRRDWKNDEFGESLGEWATVPWSAVVIVEGVTCTRRDATSVLAYTVWVEAPEDLRLSRGIARDGVNHRELWENWMAEERSFFALDKTRERADLVVPAW